MRLFLVGLVATLASVASADLAWWIEIRIEPIGTQFRGLPVTDLSTPLKRLTLLSCQSPSPTFTKEQCAEIRNNGGRFEYTGDLNGDGRDEVLNIGVAERIDGSLIGVLIISDVDSPTTNQVLPLGINGFHTLWSSGAKIDFYPCMECDGGKTLRWDSVKKQYFLEPHPEYG